MDKGRTVLLNNASSKFTKKVTIETKVCIPPQPKMPTQSAKNAIKPAANNTSSYRLIQYVLVFYKPILATTSKSFASSNRKKRNKEDSRYFCSRKEK